MQLEATGYGQALLQGQGREGAEFAGRADVLADFDSGKLGLWSGGGLHLHLEYWSGEAGASLGGALWPVNTGLTLPLGGKDKVTASSIYLSQRLGERANLLLGRINAVDLLANDPFYGGWGIRRFVNLAFVAPPSGVLPPVIVGGVLSYSLAPFRLTLMVYDPNDQTADYWPERLFHDGVNVSLGGTWAGTLAGRPASLGLTGIYSTKEGADLSQVLLPAYLKTTGQDHSFSVALQFGHLLMQGPVTPGKGLGVYAKAAIADGNPNPIRASFSGGLAGHALSRARPRDSFGIGYFYYNFSDDLQDALDPLVRFRDEQGVEVFYNLALTPWLRLTADLQFIDPAVASDQWMVVGGLRANLIF